MARHEPLQDLDTWSSHATPALVLVGLILLTSLPMPIGQWPLPNLVLIAVYIASARRPKSLPAGLLFGLGLLHDLLGSTPIGLHALEYLVVHAIATQMRRAAQSFVALWVGFIPAVAIAAAMTWAVISLYHMVWVAPDLVLTRAVASALAFPALALPVLWLIGGHRNAA